MRGKLVVRQFLMNRYGGEGISDGVVCVHATVEIEYSCIPPGRCEFGRLVPRAARRSEQRRLPRGNIQRHPSGPKAGRQLVWRGGLEWTGANARSLPLPIKVQGILAAKGAKGRKESEESRIKRSGVSPCFLTFLAGAFLRTPSPPSL